MNTVSTFIPIQSHKCDYVYISTIDHAFVYYRLSRIRFVILIKFKYCCICFVIFFIQRPQCISLVVEERYNRMARVADPNWAVFDWHGMVGEEQTVGTFQGL